MKGEDICLVESATTHTILRDQRYFLDLKLAEANVNTISSTSHLIEDPGRASITLSKGNNNSFRKCFIL